MKNLLKIFLISGFVIIYSSSFSQEVKKGLIGKWGSDVVKNSRVGTVWQFNKNGTVEITSGAVVYYVYSFNGKELISALFNHITGGTILDTSFVEIRGDSLFQKYKLKSKEYSRVMIRVGKRKKSLLHLVGTWETINIAGQKSYYKFNGDHTLILRIPLKTQKGTFNVKDFTLELKLKGEKQEVYNIKFLSHSLSLKNIRNKIEKTFQRIYD
ncbi:MAG: hypothetical protein IIB83_05015 [Bacteroidetes bacterium]|nr:hypothetical protein [Bacteroidota bacterium]